MPMSAPAPSWSRSGRPENDLKSRGVWLVVHRPTLSARYAFMLPRTASETCGYCAETGRDFALSTTGAVLGRSLALLRQKNCFEACAMIL